MSRLRVGSRVLVSARGVGTIVEIQPPYFASDHAGRRVRVDYGVKPDCCCGKHRRIEWTREMHVTVSR